MDIITGRRSLDPELADTRSSKTDLMNKEKRQCSEWKIINRKTQILVKETSVRSLIYYLFLCILSSKLWRFNFLDLNEDMKTLSGIISCWDSCSSIMTDHNNHDAVHQWDLMQHEKSGILLYRLKSGLFFEFHFTLYNILFFYVPLSFKEFLRATCYNVQISEDGLYYNPGTFEIMRCDCENKLVCLDVLNATCRPTA